MIIDHLFVLCCVQIDMSNILDQAQKIIEANGFTDRMFANLFPVYYVINW